MKKRSNGYTLIELLLVISIIVIITTVTILSFVTVRNRQKEKEYNNMVENLKTASELYLRNSNNFKDRLESNKTINLPVKVLISEGYLNEDNTINPKNNESIKENCIIISLGEKEEYVFGEPRNCGNFLLMQPNPLVIYDKDDDLLQGIIAYDINGIVIPNPDITIEAGARDKLQRNQKVAIKYTYNNNDYERLVELKLLKTETSSDMEYVVETSGYYKVTAYGAQGSGNGGLGGMVETVKYFNKGDILQLKVGTQTNGGAGLYSGGGASTVTQNGELLLAAAGGGGGATGTYGGSKTGTGGVCGENYDTNTCVNGINGQTFGTEKSISGGGSSGKYKSCTKTKTQYNPCATGSNTCVAGYVPDTSVCTEYKSCENSACGCKTYQTVYDSCASVTPNTCSYGCDSVWNPNINCSSQRTTSCSQCGYYCASGTKSGSSCTICNTYTRTSTTGACPTQCPGACNCTK